MLLRLPALKCLAFLFRDSKKLAGISFLVGVESEFILLKESSPNIVAVNHGDWSTSAKLPAGSVEEAVLQEIADTLQTAGIEVQMYHAEAAPGQVGARRYDREVSCL